MSGEETPNNAKAQLARESFSAIELQARAILREKGMSEEEIDAQLNLSKRESWDPTGPPDGSDRSDS